MLAEENNKRRQRVRSKRTLGFFAMMKAGNNVKSKDSLI